MPAPAAQALSASVSTGTVNFSASTTVPWLQVTPGNGTLGTSGIGLTVLLVTSAISGPGTHNGMVTVTAPDAAKSPQNIAVTLNVNNAPTSQTLNVTGGPLSFSFQLGSPNPAPQNISLSVTSGIAAYTALPTVSWLQISPASGLLSTTATQLSVTVTPSNLAAGIYNGSITISAPGTINGSQTVSVALVITGVAAPTLTISGGPLSFGYAIGGSAPPSQLILIITPGTSLPFTVSAATSSGGNWLLVDVQSGTTPAQCNVFVNPSGLPLGSYSGAVTVSAPEASNAPQVLPVTLTVGSPSTAQTLIVDGSPLAFYYQLGGDLPSPQTITARVSNGTAAFNIPSTGGYVQVTPSSGTLDTNGTTLSVVPYVSPNGPTITTTGSFQVAAPGIFNSPVAIPVTLIVSNLPPSPIFTTGPIPGNCQAPKQVTRFTNDVQQIYAWTPISFGTPGDRVTFSWNNPVDSNQQLTFYTLRSGGNTCAWSALPIAGTSNADKLGTWQVGYNPNDRSLFENSNAFVLSQTTTPSTASLGVTHTSLSFNYQIGGPVPPAQTIIVSSNGPPLSFNAGVSTLGGSWASITPSGTVTSPASINVTLNPLGLVAGTYMGAITVTSAAATNSPLTIPIVLNISGVPTASVSSSVLTFTMQAGSAVPPPQSLALTAGGTYNFGITATSLSGGSWVSTTPFSGSTPATITVSIDKSVVGLGPGTYSGALSIVIDAAANSPLAVSVQLVITGGPGNLPKINAIVNAASGLGSGSVSPGEMVSIFGTNIGPQNPVGLSINSSGSVNTSNGGVQVFFNGLASPISYASNSQLNVVVPYGLSGITNASAVVSLGGQTSAPFAVTVVSTMPGIFTQSGSGIGPGAIVNQDGTINTSNHPAPKGSVVLIYATGEGSTNPPGITGSITCPKGCSVSQIPVPILPVIVTLTDSTGTKYPITPVFAGEAPGFVAGVMQINAIIPDNAVSGVAQIVVGIGSNTSQPGVTVVVAGSTSASQNVNWLTFSEGDPEVPGDGKLATAVDYFHLTNPVGLSEMTNGVTFSVFPAPGQLSLTYINLTFETYKRSGSCDVHFGSVPQASAGPLKYANTAGSYWTIPIYPADVEGWVSFANQIGPGCNLTKDDLYLSALLFGTISGNVISVDAVGLGLGLNVLPQ